MKTAPVPYHETPEFWRTLLGFVMIVNTLGRLRVSVGFVEGVPEEEGLSEAELVEIEEELDDTSDGYVTCPACYGEGTYRSDCGLDEWCDVCGGDGEIPEGADEL